MTTKRQSGRDGVSGEFLTLVADNRRLTGDTKRAQTQHRVHHQWTGEKLCAMRHFVVEGLFGKRHWAREWVLGLCEADPQFVLHLADQSPGYAHFICLVRLALLERADDDADATAYARLMRGTSKKALLKDLLPTCPVGVLNVLPKLPKKPLLPEEYQQLLNALQCGKTRKYFYHARHLRKRDLHLAGISERLPGEFRSVEVMHCIKNLGDYEHFCMLVRAVQLLGVEITGREIREINEVARTTKNMENLSDWFRRKCSRLPFPAPPWKGNANIQPVRSRKALKAVGDRFKNCLKEDHYADDVSMRSSYYYVCERTPAVIRLTSHAFFGWVLDEIKGVGNRKIADAQCKKISQAFFDQGIIWDHTPSGPRRRYYWGW